MDMACSIVQAVFISSTRMIKQFIGGWSNNRFFIEMWFLASMRAWENGRNIAKYYDR